MAAGYTEQGAKRLSYDDLLCIEAEMEHKANVAAIAKQVDQAAAKLCMSKEAAEATRARIRQLTMDLRAENALHYGRFPVEAGFTEDGGYAPPSIPAYIVEGHA